MEQESKTVAERAREVRAFARKVTSLTDEELEKAVGGLDWTGGHGWGWIEQLQDHFRD